MHDLRATAPRWSKTAVVVVLIVFGLVLVVGIFGLWAFQASRESSLQTARADALVHTKTELDKIHEQVNDYLRGLLERAQKISTDFAPSTAPLRPTELLKRFLTGTKHGRSAPGAFRVRFRERGPGSAVYWFRGEYRLMDDPEAIENEAAAQNEDRQRWETLRSQAATALKESGASGALTVWREIAREFGLLTSTEGGLGSVPKADGPNFAAQMLAKAADALFEDPAAVSSDMAREIILRALEVESLTLERKGLDDEFTAFGLAEMNKELEGLLEKLPPGDATTLRWEINRFRRTRSQVKRIVENGMLLGAVQDVRNKDRLGEFVRSYVHDDFVKSEMLGISYQKADEFLVVRLDIREIESLVARILGEHERKFLSYGMEAHLQRGSESPNLPGGRQEVATMEVADLSIELPFRIIVDRVGNPEGHGEEYTDVMFWVVIGLAFAGLILAGRILVRLLTREVRLAQLKADFVSNLSHELKTPITSISLFTEMLEDGKITDPEDLKEAYSVLALESSRLQGLVHRMIDVARGEARKTPYELVPGDLNRPVLEAATRLRRIVTEPGLDLKIELHTQPLPMLMDPSSMDDVVTNLLSNAWKYKRGDRATILVRTTRRGRHAILEVRDDGIGIPKAERKKVFEMFYRADQYLTHPVAGTGLGLALVRSVVTGHKGQVRVDAGPGGVGTSFRIRFPLLRGMEVDLAVGDTTEMEPGQIQASDTVETALHDTQTAAPHGKVAPSDSDTGPGRGLEDQ